MKQNYFKEKVSFTVDEDNYKTNVLYFGDPNSKRIIGFGQGFLGNPELYDELLSEISKRDILVIAPSINGIKICCENDRRRFRNNSFSVCKETSRKCIEEAVKHINRDISDIVFMGGHSTGAATIQNELLDYEKTFIINPLLSVDFGHFGFFKASVMIGWNHIFSSSNTIPTNILNLLKRSSSAVNFFANFSNNQNLVDDFISKGCVEYYYPKKENTDALMIYAGDPKKGCDEFFEYDKYEEELASRFRSLKVRQMKGGHNEVLYNPRFFIDEVNKFLE